MWKSEDSQNRTGNFSRKNYPVGRKPTWTGSTKNMEILNGEGNPSDKFWHLEKRIKEDKRSPGVQLRLTRTDMVWNIIALINNEVISLDDLEEFSDALKETVDRILA